MAWPARRVLFPRSGDQKGANNIRGGLSFSLKHGLSRRVLARAGWHSSIPALWHGNWQSRGPIMLTGQPAILHLPWRITATLQLPAQGPSILPAVVAWSGLLLLVAFSSGHHAAAAI